MTFLIRRNEVHRWDIEVALRLLYREIRYSGLTPEEIKECQRTTFFPHLRDHQVIWNLKPSRAIDQFWGDSDRDVWCEPQIFIRFPEDEPAGPPWVPEPHIDEPPPWAEGRPYRGIVGVELQNSNSGFMWACPPGDEPQSVALSPGDAVYMNPRLPHCGSHNLGHLPRIAVYFRLLVG